MPKMGSMIWRVSSVTGSRATGSAACAAPAGAGGSVTRYQRPARNMPISLPAAGRTGRSLGATVARLPVTLLTRQIIEPVFGITDQRRDKRIDFVGGGRGLGELERLVSSGTMAVAFALYPSQMRDLMAVGDAGAVMPPKSTWFEPKLADGMVSHVLD